MDKLEFDINWTGIRFGSERHLYDSPVIVLNGHTFHLVVDYKRSIYNPCKRCALEPLCIHEQPAGIIERCCRECTPDGVGYWVADRYPVQYTLEDICKKQNYEDYYSQYACKTFDKPFFEQFEKET